MRIRYRVFTFTAEITRKRNEKVEEKEPSGDNEQSRPGFDRGIEYVILVLLIGTAGLLAFNKVIDLATAGVITAIILANLYFRSRKKNI